MKYVDWENEAATCEHCEKVSVYDAYQMYGEAWAREMKTKGYTMLVNKAGYIKPCASHSIDDAWKQRQRAEETADAYK